MPGLDPGIHPLRKIIFGNHLTFRETGIVGSMRESEEIAFWVYILASRPGGTLYVGVTNDLIRRVYEHREGLVPGFTRRYRVKTPVYFERHETALAAIQREKNIQALAP
jgi:putative endonuclease